MNDAPAVLYVDHAPALGGAEKSLLGLMAHLDPARYRPLLACAGGPLAEAAPAAGLAAPAVVLPLPRLRRSAGGAALVDLWRGASRLAAAARQHRARLIHSNTVRAAFYSAVAARLAGLPFVWHVRDFWLSEDRPRRLWSDALGKRALSTLAAAVVANSRAVAGHLPPAARARVIYNGLDLAEFAPAAAGDDFRARLGIPSGAPLVGIVGRLRPWKGQADFLRAMARLKETHPGAWFVVAGGAIFEADDAYPAGLRALAQELGLAAQTRFTGHLADPRPLLAALDVLVHCGWPEPFGLVNIEAMALETPVVAYAHGALPEIVAAGETGLLVPPGDRPALAQAVTALLDDGPRRRRMGQAGRARVAQMFTIQRTAAEVMALYDELLGRAG